MFTTKKCTLYWDDEIKSMKFSNLKYSTSFEDYVFKDEDKIG